MSSDPILSAFILTAELTVNAEYDRHLAVSYFQLRDAVSTFAVDLIGEFIYKTITLCLIYNLM